MFSFGQKSTEHLQDVNPDLVKVMLEAIKQSPYDFSITQGVRTVEQQQALFNAGKSQTMRSRHLSGNAVDIAILENGKITWEFDRYNTVAAHIKAVAKSMDIPVEWGGDWLSFKDGPHFQLNKGKYPDERG